MHKQTKHQERTSLQSDFKKMKFNTLFCFFFFYLQKTILWEKYIKQFFCSTLLTRELGALPETRQLSLFQNPSLAFYFLNLSIKPISSHRLLPGNHMWIGQLAFEFLKSIKQLSVSLSHCTNRTESFRDFPFRFISLLCLSVFVFVSPVCLDSWDIQRFLTY